MARNKRIFVSDVHMNAGRSLKPKAGKYCYDWLDETEAKDFAAFLASLSKRGDVKEVIFLGDLMDNWVCPVDEEPPTFDEILKAKHNKSIVAEIAKLCKNPDINVVYLPGNHDMGVTNDFLTKYFPGIVFGGTANFNSVFRSGRLRAEHGSAHAMFNAPDPINSPGSRLPLGYYISRVTATKQHETGDGSRHIWSYVDDLLEAAGPQTLASSVFEAVLEEARLDGSTPIVISTSGQPNRTILALDVKTRFANLYEQWKEQYGRGIAFKAVMAEIGWLEDVADRLCKKSGTNIVIFGHSHDVALDKDSWFVNDRIYANCGAWCDKKKTFVETEKDEKNGKYLIRTMEWIGGTPNLIEATDIDL